MRRGHRGRGAGRQRGAAPGRRCDVRLRQGGELGRKTTPVWARKAWASRVAGIARADRMATGTRIEGAASRGAATEAEQSKYRLRVREPPRRGREGAGSGCGASKLARCRKGVARASQGRHRGASMAPQGCRHVPQGSRGSRGWKGGALPQWCGVDEVRKRSAHACRRCRRMGCGQAPGPEQGATTLSCAIVMRCGEVCGRPTGVMLQIAA